MPVGRVQYSSSLGTNTPNTAAALALRMADKAGLGKDSAPQIGFSKSERQTQDELVARYFGLKKGSKPPRKRRKDPDA